VKYIGIIAGYTNLKDITWRKVVPIEDFNQFAVMINLNAKGLSITKKKTTRFSLDNSMYVEISGGIPSMALSNTSYTTLATSSSGYPFVTNYSLKISNASLSPLVGVGLGYQWAMQNPPGTGFFSFRTASLGVAAYAMNSLQLNGQSLFLNGDRGNSSTDQIKTNLAAVFIETKLGLFDLGRLVPYTTLGIGVAHFESINFSQTIANVNYTSTPTAVNNIAFRAELGFDFYATQALSFGIGYQYLNAGKLTLDTPPQHDSTTTNTTYNTAPQIPVAFSALSAKIRYRFKF
jgi:opacity protein-like surface antigen